MTLSPLSNSNHEDTRLLITVTTTRTFGQDDVGTVSGAGKVERSTPLKLLFGGEVRVILLFSYLLRSPICSMREGG